MFDNGVLNGLLNNFSLSDDRKGQLFENLFITQLMYTLANTDHDYRLSTYRTDAGAEVDVILELDNHVYAIEIKSGQFSPSELSGFRSFKNYYGKKVNQIVVIPEEKNKVINDIEVMSWQAFLRRLS